MDDIETMRKAHNLTSAILRAYSGVLSCTQAGWPYLRLNLLSQKDGMRRHLASIDIGCPEFAELTEAEALKFVELWLSMLPKQKGFTSIRGSA